MEDITGISIERIINSEYIKPMRMHYTQNGKVRKWDMMRVHDSVAILLYHKTRKSLIFVRQFRPAVYINRIDVQDNDYSNVDFSKYPASIGCTFELCAGIVDKNKTLKEIAQEEINEECGYHVELDKIEKITTCRSGVGVTGALQTMYYAEVDEHMQISDGGGNELEHEMIDVIYVPADDCKTVIFNEDIPKGPGLMFAVMWFLENKHKTTKDTSNNI